MKNKKQFEEVYKKYGNKIYGYIMKLCRDSYLAEDILQITFLKAIEQSDVFDGRCEISTWLCRIAHNAWLDELKRKDNQNDSFDLKKNDVMQEQDFEEEIADKDLAYLLSGIHESLHEPYREVFFLRIYREKSFAEIGKAFGMSENWARVTYYRAKEQIKDIWNEV